MKPMKKLTALALACALGLSACAGPGDASSHSAPRQDFTSVPPGAGSTQEGAPAQAMRYRSMWFSYLEWPMLDTSSAEAFTASVDTVLDHCVSLGLNCITVQVRPFADATYESELFPWSHVVTGTQGQAPGFDPLEIFIARAHEKGLAFEAWVNPYRVRLNETRPPNVAENSLENTHPEWVKQAAGGAYLEPSNPDVQAYICKGVEEIVKNYAVDGIQFDDYFYPTTDEAFDAQEYAGLGGGLSLAEWRRQNVNTLVKSVYDTVHAAAAEAGRTVVFGISPQGNNDNNYNTQYSDVGLWLSTPGYVDYVMPRCIGATISACKAGRTGLPLKTLWRNGWPCRAAKAWRLPLAWAHGALARAMAPALRRRSGRAATTLPICWARWRAPGRTATRCTAMPACLITPNMPSWPRRRPRPCASGPRAEAAPTARPRKRPASKGARWRRQAVPRPYGGAEAGGCKFVF